MEKECSASAIGINTGLSDRVNDFIFNSFHFVSMDGNVPLGRYATRLSLLKTDRSDSD